MSLESNEHIHKNITEDTQEMPQSRNHEAQWNLRKKATSEIDFCGWCGKLGKVYVL